MEDIAIILDNGTDTCKVGISGEKAPQKIIYTSGFSGITQNHRGNCYKGKKYIGDGMKQQSPFNENGWISDYDMMESLWDYAFKQLEVNPSEYPLLISEPPLNPISTRENLTRVLFESIGVPALYVANQAVLTLQSLDLNTGIVFESGESHSNAVPIYEGCAITNATKSSDLTGRLVTNYMKRLLSETYPELNSQRNSMIQQIKEQTCYLSKHYEEERQQARYTPSSFEKTIYDIKLSNERFQSTEVLFQPALFGKFETPGIHQLIYNTIESSDPTLRDTFWGNIILSGGNMMIPGMTKRLQKELNMLSPRTSPKVKLHITPKYSSWLGGSKLVSNPSMQQMWITKDEYDEVGQSIVRYRCFN